MSKSTLLAPAAVATTIPITFLASSGQGIRQLIPKLTSASDIKEKYKEVDCLKEYFGTITFNGTKANPLQSSHVKDFSVDSKSCLIVEYDKQIYKEGKWKGEFRLIWSVKDETNKQGLITVTNAITKDDGKLWGNSSAYILKKNESNNSWTTPHIQEIHLSKKTGDDFKRLIPQKNSSLPGSINTTNYWGFNPVIKDICKKDECTETETQTIQQFYYWDFTGSNGEALVHSWSSNIDHWLDKIFAWKELTSKMSSVKGKWEIK